jgi:hypothetical protein
VNRRLRDTLVLSGLLGAVPRASVRATSNSRRPTSITRPELVTSSVTSVRTALSCARGRVAHSPTAPNNSRALPGSRAGTQMSSTNGGGRRFRSAMT